MKNWIGVFEYHIDEKGTIEWLFKLLQEQKIPFKEEFKENWFGYRKPTYQRNVIIYVPKEYKEKVEKFLEEYNNPNNIVYEDVEELRNISKNEEEEQIKETKKGEMIQKILVWIPKVMLLIVIVCIIISSIMYS